MALTVQITGGKAVENGFQIAYTVNGSDRRGLCFASKQALADWVDEHSLTDEDLLAILFRIWKAKDATLTLANVTGHPITFDPTATLANVLKVT